MVPDRSIARGRYATFFFVSTVTTQRAGRLDAISLTERTNPVTNEPSIVNVAFSFRYWAYLHRRARVWSVVSNVFMRHQWSRNAVQFRDDPQDSREPLSDDFMSDSVRHEAHF